MHNPRFSHDGQSIAGWRHDGNAGVCDVDGAGCRTLGKASSAVAWSADASRLYVLRPAAASDQQEVWSMTLDGSSERKEQSVGTFRPIDRFFDVSINEEIVSAPFFEGRRELWTATVH